MDILGTIRKWSAGLAETAISLAAISNCTSNLNGRGKCTISWKY